MGKEASPLPADMNKGEYGAKEQPLTSQERRCPWKRVTNKKALDDLKAIAPEFAKFTQDFLFGDIWKRPELSQRDKSLITVTCLVALNRIEQVDFHLKKAFENGLTKEELVGADIAFYAGWPIGSLRVCSL